MYTFKQLQDEHRLWVAHNFPTAEPYKFLLGAMEELGELCHAQLKSELGIRAGDWNARQQDAVADIIIFLAGYCSVKGYDLETLVTTTWSTVKQRDWVNDPVNGGNNHDH